MTQRAALPDLDTLNLEALKALIIAQHEQIHSKDEQLASREEEIERLKLLIAKLRRMQFGQKSEKLTGRSSSWSCSWTNWRRAERSRPLLHLFPWPRRT
jgi:Transposase C of IS166 homeodomain